VTPAAASLVGAIDSDKPAPTLGAPKPADTQAPSTASDKSALPGLEDGKVRIVNSKRIGLHYELKGTALADVAGVELWCTRDTRTWVRRDMQPPTAPACVVDVSDEDLYGLTLVVRNVNGIGRPPMEGDKPQVWVEVDLTNPTVRLMGVDVERDNASRSYTIRWRAADKNLADKPISIFYAWQPDGPWTPIVRDIENSGQYIWVVPPSTPNRLFIRVQAADVGGNVGHAQTPEALEDYSQPPTATIRTVEAIDN
jgi:hypothetical protein